MAERRARTGRSPEPSRGSVPVADAGVHVRARANARRALALRLAPVERCMFIGPADVSETVACKLSGHGGIRARLVAVLDFAEIGPWSAQAQAIGRLAEIRELARTLDVQRAIVAPRGGDAAE